MTFKEIISKPERNTLRADSLIYPVETREHAIKAVQTTQFFA